MKKKIIGLTMFVAIAVTVSWNLAQGETKMNLSDITLANIEALALCEKTNGSCYMVYGSWQCCSTGNNGCSPCGN